MNNDLISRSALLENTMPVSEFVRQNHDTHVISVRQINNAPAVDAEPVRHGYWMPKTYSIAACSVCEQHHFAHVQSWKYCPNCGAKMDGDANV